MELKTLPPSVWRDALVAEDTEAFLSAVRNYLGPVPTPYNKHDLVARLEAFLKKPETGDAQAALLDSLDARILGALAAAGPCSEGFLRELLADEHGPWELSLRLANLRDRLVLFRAPSSSGPILAVTPALAPRLAREADLRGLLGCSPWEGPPPPPGVDADTICAAASILFHQDGPLRRDGRPSKRVRTRLLSLLPELAGFSPIDGRLVSEGASGDPEARRAAPEPPAGFSEAAGSGGSDATLDALIAGFRGAGLLIPAEGGAEGPDMLRLADVAEAWGERLPFLLAEAARELSFRPDGDAGPPPRPSLPERARLLESIAAAIPPGAAVSEAGFRRLALLSIEPRGGAGAARAESCAEALLRFGLVRRTASGIVRAAAVRRAPRIAPGSGVDGEKNGTPGSSPVRASEDAGPSGPVLAVEASHALRVLPEADPVVRAFSGTVGRLESRGEVWSCVLDRKSVRRALDAGLGSERIVRTLEALSGRALPQSLAFSLAGWEKEHLSVRLYYGYVLAAEGPARTRAENAPSLVGLRGPAVADGAWLLRSDDPGEIRVALERAGMHAPRIRRAEGLFGPRDAPEGRETPGGPVGDPGAPADRPAWSRLLDPAAAVSGEPRRSGPSEIRARLRARLESLDAPEGRRAELADRIDRRIILSEDQLTRAETDGPGLEAGALDYMGKVRVIERVLRSGGAVLEILARRADGQPELCRVRPLELEKTERGLVLRAADAEDGSVRVLSVSSMSHVKRIKTTLFGD